MKTSPKYPMHLEDRKALKLMERIEKIQVLRAKNVEGNSQQTAAPKPSHSVAY
jgi:hypothetical protein